MRTGTSPLLDLLDCPDPSVATPRRSVTSTPLQALALLNNAFMEHYSARFANRVEREVGDDPATQVRRTYALAFSRQPTKSEESYGSEFVAKHDLSQFCLVLLNTNEFLYID